MELDKIINGDCLKLLMDLPDNSIDLIVTSPPYNKGFFTKTKKGNQVWGGFEIKYNTYNDNLPLQEYEKFMIELINVCMCKLKENGSMFFNHKPIRYNNRVYFPLTFIAQSNAIIYQEIIWNRKNSPNIRKDCLLPCTERIYWLTKGKPKTYRDNLDKSYISEVWDISAKPYKEHPAPFPLELPENCIKLTTIEGDVVLDPFMGSGTTALACKKLNRHYIGFELDNSYCNLANKRLNDL